jgi:hypothetical protein
VKIYILLILLCSSLTFADARQIDEYQWEGVERIVAIGDLHGDYDNYIATLSAAGLVDKKGKWSGGKTHLVQNGDIPDRGPDTRKIIEHISKLGKQAKRKGGRVHNLIGNHEAMNMYGDLRYVSPGEFEAFVTRNSEKLRDRVFEVSMQNLSAADPSAFSSLPENYRETWNKQHPLGWVEHRQAWDPAWNPDGEYAKWVMSKKVAVKVNDTVFLHGGISGFYCKNSLQSLTEEVIANLREYQPGNSGILEDDFGPLWYRGLSGSEPMAGVETVDAILAYHRIKHVAVGHTVTSGVIWPRYDGKVLMIDTGISRVYGGHIGYLEITPEGLFGGYPNGKVPIPTDESGLIPYLEKVIALDPENKSLRDRLQELRQPPLPVIPKQDAGLAGDTDLEPGPKPMPICGISE